jgi:hypothetical protein
VLLLLNCSGCSRNGFLFPEIPCFGRCSLKVSALTVLQGVNVYSVLPHFVYHIESIVDLLDSGGYSCSNIIVAAILQASLGPGVYRASNRNEYQKHKNNHVSWE